MATIEIVHEEYIPCDEIDIARVRCPRCQSADLILYGNSQVERIETLKGGEIVNTVVDEKSHAFELEAIECPSCKKRYRLQEQEIVDLQKKVDLLERMYRNATGKAPFGEADC